MWCPRLLTLWTIDSLSHGDVQFFCVSSPIGRSSPFFTRNSDPRHLIRSDRQPATQITAMMPSRSGKRQSLFFIFSSRSPHTPAVQATLIRKTK